jgi:hypothetical protein
MASASKLFRINTNTVIEYTYSDNSSVMSEDYWVAYYKQLDYFHFSQDTVTFGNSSSTNNVYTRQLMSVDNINKRWAPLDITNSNLIVRDYSAGDLIPYDIIKVYFPINWTFADYQGFMLRIWCNDYNEARPVLLSQVYYDKELHNADPLGSIEFLGQPKLFDGTLFGKYFLVKIPSPYYVSRMRNVTSTSNIALPGSLNYTLNGGLGISATSPIYFEWSYLTKRVKTTTGYEYYNGTENRASIPQSAEFQTLGVNIQESTDGDYFEISGIYNGSTSEFANFMQALDDEGNPCYIIYTISIIEQNIKVNSFDVFVGEDFGQPFTHRPIIKTSTTTAAIDVEMKIISRRDNSTITKNGSIGLVNQQINKYGKSLSRINVTGIYKPKIYNPVPDQIIVKMNEQIVGQSSIQYVPVFYDRSNILIRSENTLEGATEFISNGQLEIIIHPKDNIFKFIIATKVSDEAVEFLNIPTTTTPYMLFNGKSQQLEVPLFEDGMNDLSSGQVSFHFTTTQTAQIMNMYNQGDRTFIIYLSNEAGFDTTIYTGKFILSNLI